MKHHIEHQAFTIRIRTDLKAGRVVCVDVPDNPIVPPTPPPPFPPGPGPWLNCQSCHGTKIAEGHLQNAKCEVCTL